MNFEALKSLLTSLYDLSGLAEEPPEVVENVRYREMMALFEGTPEQLLERVLLGNIDTQTKSFCLLVVGDGVIKQCATPRDWRSVFAECVQQMTPQKNSRESFKRRKNR